MKHPYSSFFSPDLPPAYMGNLVLYGIASTLMLAVVVGVSAIGLDAWNDMRDDPQPRRHPLTIWRKTVILWMVGSFMRSFPLMVQNLCRPEMSDTARLYWSLATNLGTGFSYVPFIIGAYLYFMSKKVVAIQLKKEPIAVDIRTRWERIRKLAVLTCLVVAIGVVATLQAAYASDQEALASHSPPQAPHVALGDLGGFLSILGS